VDLDTGEVVTPANGDLTITGNNTTFSTQMLTTNRRYKVTVSSTNAAGSDTTHVLLSEYDLCTFATVSEYIHVGTHDILNATVIMEDEVILTVEFSEHSTASGALFSFVYITESGDLDFTRSFLLTLDRNSSYNYTLPSDLHPGHYMVHVYDIECDGVLSSGVGYPAVTDELINTVTIAVGTRSHGTLGV
jgi:hypothetical protein